MNARCRVCGERLVPTGKAGRPRTTCPEPRTCRATAQALDYRTRRDEQFVERMTGDAERRALTLGAPGREALARAVRLVGHARGRDQTIERLLVLAAVARTWAVLLGMREPTDHDRALRRALGEEAA